MYMTDIAGVRERTIPTGLIVKDVIQDDRNGPPPRYEKWLLEFINHSESFMRITGGESFHAPGREDHGESDAITHQYEIDFKLILGESMQHALRETSRRFHTLSDGLTLVQPGRREEAMQATWLHNILRGMAITDLRPLWGKDPKGLSNLGQHDIAAFLKTLDKDKNLFLLLPELLFADDGELPPAEVIGRAVCSDYEGALQMRRECHPDRDTYLAFFLPGRIEIFMITGDSCVHFDSVPTSASKTFLEICRCYSPLDYGHIDVLLADGTTYRQRRVRPMTRQGLASTSGDEADEQ